MRNCIWKVKPEDRHCEYCTYRGGCDSYESVDPCRDRKAFERYKEAMEEICGEGVLNGSRNRRSSYCRYMIAYQMRTGGTGSKEIGEFLGIDRSTVIYGVKMMMNMLRYPGMYPEETNIYQKFLKRIEYA